MEFRFESTGIREEERVKEILEKEGYSVYVHEEGRASYPNHVHVHREVRWVVEGELIIGVGERVFVLKPGDMLELPPGVEHWARVESRARYVCGSKDG